MKKTIILIVLFLILGLRGYADESPAISEDELKAAFIFHFITFTEWDDNAPNYNVCIPNNESLRKAAQNVFKDKVVNNRKVVVTDIAPVCHVLVSDQAPLNKNTLTIGEINRGALLEFRLIKNKLRFAANVENIKKTNLKISSQLLKLAILENENL
jgi:hypothetical protein